ncbi:MAG: hypothetical protein GX241_00835 [Ruminococcaceae bacterium]|nr:hypothetical protein [Oscillospiraceae bacterium]
METLSVNVGAELDLLLFELELKNKNKDEEYLLSTASDNDEKLIEEYKFSSIDREIRQDPILMLKHIKQNIKK